jgi:hypothetical protein
MMQLLLLIFKKRYESFRAKKRLTPLLSCAGLVSTDVGMPQKLGRKSLFEIMPRWPRQRAARR